jgi:hypothetical protein
VPEAIIGAWKFHVPEGWEPEDRDSKVSYLVAPDGAAGMYVKHIDMTTPYASAHSLATYLQNVHEAAFNNLDDSSWDVMERRDSVDMDIHRSALDLLDVAASYRVVSFVVCDTRDAIQVTNHDYMCVDYAATQDRFADVEKSILRNARA